MTQKTLGPFEFVPWRLPATAKVPRFHFVAGNGDHFFQFASMNSTSQKKVKYQWVPGVGKKRRCPSTLESKEGRREWAASCTMHGDFFLKTTAFIRNRPQYPVSTTGNKQKSLTRDLAF